VKKKRGRPPKQTRLDDGPASPVKLTPTQSRIMDHLVTMHLRGALPYGRHWNANLASAVARELGLRPDVVSRYVQHTPIDEGSSAHERLFREEFYRRTLDSRRKTPGDFARLLARLEDGDRAEAETARLANQLVRQHLKSGGRDDWERAIRLWVRIKNTIK
jgi:hypothetical protein